MSTNTAAAVIRMCNRIWVACPWAAPEGWEAPQSAVDTFKDMMREHGIDIP